ncbi:MAG: rRNA maturation RNase YbeY [Vicinamibacteria bacterium]|nr:rRNA maturation RNase YbeY [Vicinamibacteria bacterium]
MNRQRLHILQRESIRRLLHRAAAALRVTGELALVFAGDALLRRLNRDYRFKDKPTDVLSFESQDEDMGLGDVVISVETARRNALSFSRTLDRELEVLALHGFLHALGFDHESDHGEMEAIEKKLRARLLSRGPTITRARKAQPTTKRRTLPASGSVAP